MKYIFICFSILWTVYGYGQNTVKTFRFKSVSYKSIINDGQGNYAWSGEWSSEHIVITVDFENLGIEIYSKITQNFDIVQSYPTYKVNDYIWFKWDCIDQSGEKCSVRMVVYDDSEKSQYNAELYVDYPDHTLDYRVKKQ